MAHLGEKLKEFREQKGWTQPQMADYLSIGYRTYQTIEKKGDVKLVADLKKIMKIPGMDTQIFAYPHHGNGQTASAGDLLDLIKASSDETNLLVKAILTQQIGYSESISATLDKVASNPEGTTVGVAGTIEQRIWRLLKDKGIDAIARK
jgi:transcriptional regulator with XRE-family HTH domain